LVTRDAVTIASFAVVNMVVQNNIPLLCAWSGRTPTFTKHPYLINYMLNQASVLFCSSGKIFDLIFSSAK
jgi:hypothetical protein